MLALNPDTELHEGTAPDSSALMEEHPEIGIAGCRVSSGRTAPSITRRVGRSRPCSARSGTSAASAGGSCARPARRTTARRRSSAGPVDAVNGAFMLIRRAALDEVGLFDEGYWMYMEDLDLCYRFRRGRAGSRGTSRRSRSSTSRPGRAGTDPEPRLNYAFHYGMYRFYRTHLAAERSAPFNALVYAGIALKFLSSATASAAARARHRLDAAGAA